MRGRAARGEGQPQHLGRRLRTERGIEARTRQLDRCRRHAGLLCDRVGIVAASDQLEHALFERFEFLQQCGGRPEVFAVAVRVLEAILFLVASGFASSFLLKKRSPLETETAEKN